MISTPSRILVIDDDSTSLFVLSGYLKREGYTVVTAANGEQALEHLVRQSFDLLISDLRMPGMDGIMLLEEIRRRDITTPLIIVTACGSIASAVEAIRKGAYDYIEKPFNPDNLQLTVERVLNYHRAVTENNQIKAYLEEHFTFQNLITVNPAMKQMLGMAARVASSPRTTVAIYGESGTGKEVLARAIHYASTGMPTRFVAVNCAAIPEQLLESELFGHVKGAFTGADKEREGKFQQARGGTLLLDEIGDLPFSLQTKLLRALQERTFEKVGGNDSMPLDCRVIVATNANLAARVATGSFREDLFHRIDVFPLHIPPLRERKDDIKQICVHVISELHQHLGKTVLAIATEAMDAILAHNWPGNVRELRNRLERGAILTSDGHIRTEHLGLLQQTEASRDGEHAALPYTTYTLKVPNDALALASLTSQILSQTLARCQGNKSKAAQLLKIDRKMFYRE